MKTCSTCREQKPLGEFYANKRSGDGYHSRCKECAKAASVKSYHANHVTELAKRRKRNSERAAEKYRRLVAAKNVPCADCGGTFPPVCMDFDHIPGRGPKRRGVGQMINSYSWPDIEAEIAKCEVVCANCHRIRTASRRQSWSSAAAREVI